MVSESNWTLHHSSYLYHRPLDSVSSKWTTKGPPTQTARCPLTTKQGNQVVITSNSDYQTWRTYDQFCLTSIFVSVSTDTNLQLVGIQLAAEAWWKLPTLFDCQIHAKKGPLDEQWWYIEMAIKWWLINSRTCPIYTLGLLSSGPPDTICRSKIRFALASEMIGSLFVLLSRP